MKTIHHIAGMLSLMAAGLCSSAEALELKDLHLPMTRDEADGSLTKDYQFTILSDSTIRRTWKLKGRTVHVDFKLNKQGQALCIAVEYAKPASRKTVHNDIKAVTDGKSNYKKLGKPKKNTNTYGMEHALGAKVKGDKSEGWIFVEHTSAARKKCTRFVYYATKPSRDRMSLSEAREDGGYTALGSSGSNIDLSAIVADEEDRRRTKASATAKPDKTRPVLADTPEEPVVSTTDTEDDFGTPDTDADWEDDAADTEDTAAEAAAGKGFLPQNISAPVQKILGLSPMITDVLIVLIPLLLLIIIWRTMVGKARAKARKKAFESIMGKKPEQKQQDAE